jgi:hypothetical protein
MAWCDSECRGEQGQQRGDRLVVDFTEKTDAEEQEQNECRAGWISCHSATEVKKATRRRELIALKTYLAKAFRPTGCARNALSFTIGFEIDTFPPHCIQMQERFVEMQNWKG